MSKITINNVDQHIDRLERAKGVLLFQTKKVVALNEVDDDVWEAVVETPDPLSVGITLRKDIITSFECDCQDFTNREICSHIYATLLAINKERSQTLTRSEISQECQTSTRGWRR
jgi:uncharacterized Zn finger protein